ncbi:MAG: hypothetical protein EB033_15970 [Proteobacteria bacterium]|nr:hypothetical protein [Pseudomonadota bacterium]
MPLAVTNRVVGVPECSGDEVEDLHGAVPCLSFAQARSSAYYRRRLADHVAPDWKTQRLADGGLHDGE